MIADSSKGEEFNDAEKAIGLLQATPGRKLHLRLQLVVPGLAQTYTRGYRSRQFVTFQHLSLISCKTPAQLGLILNEY